MNRAGVDRATAKLISGHRTDAIFDRYNVQDGRDLAEAMEKRVAYEAKLTRGGNTTGHVVRLEKREGP